MASILLAGPFNVIAGSIGGSTFQRHPVTAVFKNKPRYSKYLGLFPAALKTSSVKNYFQYVTGQWRNLTSLQRSNWASAALLFIRYNKFGIPYNPSAYQLFVELNMGLVLDGIALSQSAPAVSSFPPVTFTVTWSSVLTQFNITQVVPAGSANYKAIIYASPMVSYGITVPPKTFKIVATVALSTGTSITNIAVAYIAQYGSITAGMAAWVGIKSFNAISGELTGFQYFSVQF